VTYPRHHEYENVRSRVVKIGLSQMVIFRLSKPSVGIALYPDNGEDINELIKLADEAMYRVKNGGKNGFAFANKKSL